MVKLFVEPIPPVFLCCDTLLTAADIASASRFQRDSRRNEHLAWRRIVRRELGRDTIIDYNDVGAPTVDKTHTYISVAHTKGLVAVAIADRRVGIDIELRERHFESVKERYMNSHEMQLSEEAAWPAYVWTAKEALYKLYGRRELELVSDLCIVECDSELRHLRAKVADGRFASVEMSTVGDDAVVAVATFE